MLKSFITFFLLLVVYITPVYSQTELNFEGFEEKANNYMNALCGVGEFSGTVLVAYKGQIKFNKGYGLASKRFNVPNDTTTKFRIASMTKSFTAISILQLYEQGKLSIDDSISKFLDFPFGEQITIKHLLSHSSGIKRDIDFPDENKKYQLDELIDMSKSDSLLFDPGTATAYSNCNYILLQYILEKVSGIDYETYVSKNVLLPLGLKNTGIEHPLSPPTLLADGFRAGIDENGNLEFQEIHMLSHGYPDAVTALYSTTGDLLKFCRSLGKSSILKPTTWKMAFEPVVIETPFFNWGLGFSIIGNGDVKVLNHNGRTTGFKGGYYQDLNDDFTLIILGNNTEIGRSLIVNTFQAILNNQEYYEPKVYNEIELNKNLIKDLVGKYQTDQFSFTISEFNNQLYVKSHGDAPSLILPYENDSFFSKYFDLKLRFKRENNIVVESEWIFQNESLIAKKVL